MVTLTATKIDKDEVQHYGYATYKLKAASQNDVFTLSDFTTLDDLKKAVLMNQSDGAEITNSISKNQVTVTGAATNVNLICWVFGRLA